MIQIGFKYCYDYVKSLRIVRTYFVWMKIIYEVKIFFFVQVVFYIKGVIRYLKCILAM